MTELTFIERIINKAKDSIIDNIDQKYIEVKEFERIVKEFDTSSLLTGEDEQIILGDLGLNNYPVSIIIEGTPVYAYTAIEQ